MEEPWRCDGRGRPVDGAEERAVGFAKSSGRRICPRFRARSGVAEQSMRPPFRSSSNPAPPCRSSAPTIELGGMSSRGRSFGSRPRARTGRPRRRAACRCRGRAPTARRAAAGAWRRVFDFATTKTEPTISPFRSAIQQRSRAGSKVLDEIGDDARDEGLEPLVPAVLPGVQHAVAVDDPAHVARTVRAKRVRLLGLARRRRRARLERTRGSSLIALDHPLLLARRSAARASGRPRRAPFGRAARRLCARPR